MKQKRAAQIFQVFCFLTFLLLGAAVTLLRPWEDYSYFENRDLAGIPELTREAFWDGSWFSSLENTLADHAAGRTTLLKAATLADLDLIHRPIVNDITCSNGKLLHWLDYEIVDPQALEAQAQAAGETQEELRQLVETCGGRYLYVAIPGQYVYFADDYPGYLNNRSRFTALSREAFARAMERAGVSLLDVGPAFDAMGHPEEFYSATDHHYTYAGAYQTYRLIMDRLGRETGLDLAVLEEDDLSFEALPNPYLGSRGRKLFGLRPVEERAQIAQFKDPVAFTRANNGVDVPPTLFALPAGPWEAVSYELYMGGDIAETVIDTGRPELPSLLIYGDSYTNALETLLWYSFGETRSIDLRQYTGQSLADYIRDFRPDVVLCIKDYGTLLAADGNGDPFARNQP